MVCHKPVLVCAFRKLEFIWEIFPLDPVYALPFHEHVTNSTFTVSVFFHTDFPIFLFRRKVKYFGEYQYNYEQQIKNVVDLPPTYQVANFIPTLHKKKEFETVTVLKVGSIGRRFRWVIVQKYLATTCLRLILFQYVPFLFSRHMYAELVGDPHPDCFRVYAALRLLLLHLLSLLLSLPVL